MYGMGKAPENLEEMEKLGKICSESNRREVAVKDCQKEKKKSVAAVTGSSLRCTALGACRQLENVLWSYRKSRVIQ